MDFKQEQKRKILDNKKVNLEKNLKQTKKRWKKLSMSKKKKKIGDIL